LEDGEQITVELKTTYPWKYNAKEEEKYSWQLLILLISSVSWNA
jgi:hypothetical protein